MRDGGVDASMAPPFLQGGGPTGALIRELDWRATPLGAPQEWPGALRTLMSVMLAANQPMFLCWGPERTFIYNDDYAAILGLRHPRALGGRFDDAWHDVLDQVGPLVDRAYAGEPTRMDDIGFVMYRNGYAEETHFSFFYTPVRDDDGRIGGMFCACQEITDRVLAERQTMAEARRRHELFLKAPGFIAILHGQDHVFEFANDAYRRLVGNRDVLGLPLRSALPEIAMQGFVEVLDRVFVTGERYTAVDMPVMLQRKDDTGLEQFYLDFIYEPIVNAAGIVTGIFVQGSDVTGFKRAERQLTDSQARFRAAIRAIGTLWTNNAEGRMEGAQPGWEELTGQTFEEYQGYGWAAAVHPDDAQPTIDAWQRAVTSRSNFTFEHRVRRHDGEWRTCQIRAVPVVDSDGAIREWVGVHVDITAQKDAENERQALLERERVARAEAEVANRTKDEFMAVLGHELRNPLSPISTALYLMKMKKVDGIQEERQIIERQVAHMTRLVDDLLDISRITSGRIQLKREYVDLEDVVKGAAEMVRPLMEQRRHKLHLLIGSAAVIGDRVRLAQVLSNLLTNAARYTPEGGEIHVSLVRFDDTVEIGVRDNGVGIPAEMLPRVFDMFVQHKQTIDRAAGGLGLGLAIVRSLVLLHGGHVSVESRGPGLGSEFVVRLPAVATREVEVPGGWDEVEVARAKGQRLLIVDDNVDSANLLAKGLGQLGYVVDVAYEGEGALAQAQTSAPDAAILDIGLPRMDGYQLARRLRALPQCADIPLLALSGYGQDHDRRMSQDAGFNQHLTKPADLTMVATLLEKYLQRRTAPKP
jgi:PAS domain S-box-containing protein